MLLVLVEGVGRVDCGMKCLAAIDRVGDLAFCFDFYGISIASHA